MQQQPERPNRWSWLFFFLPGTREQSHSEQALRGLVIIMIIGLLGVILYGAQNETFLVAATTGILIGGAALMIGGFLGFLFGIPRTLQGENAGARETEYRANTNLEQISDWLTKILVGVGLTQLSEVPNSLRQLGLFIVDQSGGAIASPTFALAAVLFFMVCGFLFGYLWTRLFLPGAFREADVALVIKKLGQQPELDAKALSLAQRQLEPRSDTSQPVQQELNEAITAASPLTKLTIAEQARSIRKNNWQSDKPQMETTIPLFRALVASDPDKTNHEYRSQLGFALRDQRNPDFAEAEAFLTEAIAIRGHPRTEGYLYYELVRAICRIMQDSAFRDGKESPPEVRDRIISDLSACVSELELVQPPIPEIDRWMKLNKVTFADLKK